MYVYVYMYVFVYLLSCIHAYAASSSVVDLKKALLASGEGQLVGDSSWGRAV